MPTDSDSDEELCLKVKSSNWYLDSGCFKHMIGDASKFSHLTPKKHGHVTCGENKGKIVKVGKVGKTPSTSIENVCLLMVLSIIYLALVNYAIKEIESSLIQIVTL